MVTLVGGRPHQRYFFTFQSNHHISGGDLAGLRRSSAAGIVRFVWGRMPLTGHYVFFVQAFFGLYDSPVLDDSPVLASSAVVVGR